MHNNILIIYTGGTIGMQPSEHGYIPVPGFEALIQERLAHSHHALLPNFDLIELAPLIDSANLTPHHWNLIADPIIKNHDKYDGFIVLHGTDTMAYSASMLSFILQGLRKPVIFTGSQIPLSELRNDALDNLITSMLLASDETIHEVCIYFSGRLLRGNRSSKVKATGLDAFDSPNYPWLGQIGLHIELHPNLFIPKKTGKFINPTFDDNTVSILPIFPGMDGKIVDFMTGSNRCKAIILRSYGVGNLPNHNKSLMDALQRASDKNVILVNISQCLQAEIFQGQYASSSILNKMGVISGAEMTLEATYTKLHFLLSTGIKTEDVKAMFANSLAGEINP